MNKKYLACFLAASLWCSVSAFAMKADPVAISFSKEDITSLLKSDTPHEVLELIGQKTEDFNRKPFCDRKHKTDFSILKSGLFLEKLKPLFLAIERGEMKGTDAIVALDFDDTLIWYDKDDLVEDEFGYPRASKASDLMAGTIDALNSHGIPWVIITHRDADPKKAVLKMRSDLKQFGIGESTVINSLKLSPYVDIVTEVPTKEGVDYLGENPGPRIFESNFLIMGPGAYDSKDHSSDKALGLDWIVNRLRNKGLNPKIAYFADDNPAVVSMFFDTFYCERPLSVAGKPYKHTLHDIKLELINCPREHASQEDVLAYTKKLSSRVTAAKKIEPLKIFDQIKKDSCEEALSVSKKSALVSYKSNPYGYIQKPGYGNNDVVTDPEFVALKNKLKELHERLAHQIIGEHVPLHQIEGHKQQCMKEGKIPTFRWLKQLRDKGESLTYGDLMIIYIDTMIDANDVWRGHHYGKVFKDMKISQHDLSIASFKSRCPIPNIGLLYKAVGGQPSNYAMAARPFFEKAPYDIKELYLSLGEEASLFDGKLIASEPF